MKSKKNNDKVILSKKYFQDTLQKALKNIATKDDFRELDGKVQKLDGKVQKLQNDVTQVMWELKTIQEENT